MNRRHGALTADRDLTARELARYETRRDAAASDFARAYWADAVTAATARLAHYDALLDELDEQIGGAR